MSCPDCISVKCWLHLPKNASPRMRQRSNAPSTMRFWLAQWKKAEQRLKAAKAELRSARAKVLGFRRRGGVPGKRFIRLNGMLWAATEEVRLARADKDKKRDSFASVARWFIDGKTTKEVR